MGYKMIEVLSRLKNVLEKRIQRKITLLRILDSRREQYRLSATYLDKIEVIDIITASEIKMLIIFNEDKYKEFKKSGMKPSDFCKVRLKHHSIKSYKFAKDYPELFIWM